MRIDAQQQMLDDHQVAVAGHVERRPPATGHGGLSGPRPHVPVREGLRELLHPLRFGEATRRGGRLDPVGDTGIQRREVSATVAGVERNAAQLLDRRRQHPASHGTRVTGIRR